MLAPALPPTSRNKRKKNVNCTIHLKKIRCVLYGSSKPQEMPHISLQCEPTFGNNDGSHYSSLLLALLFQPHSPVFNIFLIELCSICNTATGAKLVLSILNGCTCAAVAPKASTLLLCIQASLAVCGSTAFFFAC